MADRLEGPWSEPRPWLDCSAIAQPAVPTCYSPFQHPELSGGGRRLFITFARFATYDTVAYELTLGTAIHQYQSDGGEVTYAADPPSEGRWRDLGVAFYASDAPLPGFAAVYRWQSGAEVRYEVTTPDPDFVRGNVAFYAPATELVANGAIRLRPVFDWHHGTSHLLAPAGASVPLDFEQGVVAFYAP